MSKTNRNFPWSLFFLISITISLAPPTPAQKSSEPQQPDDVIRIKSELVRSDVTVVDKQGRFVDGLKPEQFELRVDGRVQPITFFERVTAGSPEEEKQLAAAEKPNGAGQTKPDDTAADKAERAEGRGRVIFFFVDDVHLDGDSLYRARTGLLRFVEKQMRPTDRVAIISTSGQVGFLQQLTDNKAVLREAIDRLHFKRAGESPAMEVPISEVDANLVANHRDAGLFSYLVEATAKQYQMSAFNAFLLVKQRLRQINMQSRIVEMQSLLGLESLMRSSQPLVGRKLVFFISDGFIVDVKKSSAPDILRRVINEAARVGAVVYTMDTRAIFSNPGIDAARNDYPDFSSRQAGRNLAETKMPQEILETLAADTGGRSFLNPNEFDDALALAIRETSDYYLLDWRPDTESQRAGTSRLEVVVKDRPELRVRLRRHIFSLKPEETAAATPAKKATAPAITPEDELRATLGSLYPHVELPTSLSVGYVRTPTGGMTLNVAMQLDGAALNFEKPGERREGTPDEKLSEKTQTEVDVLGVALDDRGSFSSFKQKLTVRREAVFAKDDHFVQWNQALPLPPGLYQVRVAVRERETGRTGSAMQWIEIPKIDPTTFTMSDIFIGERKTAEATAQKIAVKVNRSFARDSFLRYQAYLYNAARATGTPQLTGGTASQLTLEVKVLRGSRTVFTVPESKPGTSNADDPTSLPLSGEISLEQFPPGHYTLQISATERGAKTSVTQKALFVIE